MSYGVMVILALFIHHAYTLCKKDGVLICIDGSSMLQNIGMLELSRSMRRIDEHKPCLFPMEIPLIFKF